MKAPSCELRLGNSKREQKRLLAVLPFDVGNFLRSTNGNSNVASLSNTYSIIIQSKQKNPVKLGSRPAQVHSFVPYNIKAIIRPPSVLKVGREEESERTKEQQQQQQKKRRIKENRKQGPKTEWRNAGMAEQFRLPASDNGRIDGARHTEP